MSSAENGNKMNLCKSQSNNINTMKILNETMSQMKRCMQLLKSKTVLKGLGFVLLLYDETIAGMLMSIFDSMFQRV